MSVSASAQTPSDDAFLQAIATHKAAAVAAQAAKEKAAVERRFVTGLIASGRAETDVEVIRAEAVAQVAEETAANAQADAAAAERRVREILEVQNEASTKAMTDAVAESEAAAREADAAVREAEAVERDARYRRGR